jgi:hypothetical protein
MADPRLGSSGRGPALSIPGGRDAGEPIVAIAPRSTWIIPFVLASAMLSDRAFVTLATGGQGIFPLLAVLAPLAAIACVTRYGIERSLAFFTHPIFVVGVLPYLVLTATLPILGVMFHAYPERTLLSLTDATTAVSFLVLGAAAASNGERGWAKWLVPAIGLQLAYALAQAINWARGPGWELFTPFAEWDHSLATLEGQLESAGRSTGLFTNPNELGLWAAMAAVLAWTVLPGRQRGIGVALAVLTLLMSQSRGPAVGLVAAVVAGAVFGIARGRLLSSTAIRAVVTLAVAGLLVTLAFAFQVVDVSLDRFGFLIQVLTQGPQADVNLAARLNLWSGVLQLNLAFPWGTWGSPELLLGTAIDSAWFRAFAQGSAIYVAAVALLFGGAMAVRNAAYGDALRLTSVVLAVVGLTQTTLGAPVIPVFWALLGIYLGSSVATRARARSAQVRSVGAGISTAAGA